MGKEDIYMRVIGRFGIKRQGLVKNRSSFPSILFAFYLFSKFVDQMRLISLTYIPNLVDDDDEYIGRRVSDSEFGSGISTFSPFAGMEIHL